MTRRIYDHRIWQAIVRGTCFMAVVALLWPGGTVGAAQVPVLTLEPDRGSCTTILIIRGASFPPGQVVELTSRAGRTNVVRLLARPVVAPDGTFVVRAEMWQLEATCRRIPPQQRIADGTPYTILASVGGDRPGTVLARAIFTFTEDSAALPGLPNTGGGGALHRAPPGNWLVAMGAAALLGGMLGCARVRRRARS